MKRTTVFLLLACIFLAGLLADVCRAGEGEESQLIQILRSPTNSLAEKSDACARLKHIGTSHSLAALAVLLTNADLSISARNALQSMPYPAAGRALLKALP
ncbi:MAG TPA: hypothetical protein VFB72_05345, partial [Verrucomicrobiae bacterium]|nr:hypothetical protein [Verrucomicrobiae bacterium]